MVSSQWRLAPLPIFSTEQKDWLTRKGSLTQYLQAWGTVTVRVMREVVDVVWLDECHCLRIRAYTPVWLREVLLCVNGVPFVAARSVMSLAASRSVWRVVRNLGSQPLGHILYRQIAIDRSALMSRRVKAPHQLYQLAQSGILTFQKMPHSLLARRSVFIHRGAALLVTEVMLDALWARLRPGSAR